MLIYCVVRADIRVGAYYCPSLFASNDYWSPDATTALAIGCRPNYNPLINTTLWQRVTTYIAEMNRELISLYKPDLFWWYASFFFYFLLFPSRPSHIQLL